LGQKVDPASKKRAKLLNEIGGLTSPGRAGIITNHIGVIEYSSHDGEKIQTHDSMSQIISTIPGKKINVATVSMLVNGTPTKTGSYVVQVDGRVFRKASNVPLMSEQILIDQMITTQVENGRPRTYVLCNRRC